jgi:hypothetical protein
MIHPWAFGVTWKSIRRIIINPNRGNENPAKPDVTSFFIIDILGSSNFTAWEHVFGMGQNYILLFFIN